mmetsp:Transcript_31613/g.35391  ORF Transcript_31613/g.35391 Transcript_31613/m.35391 type:complete len:468 (-) Transcript_31613:1711-3114(-)
MLISFLSFFDRIYKRENNDYLDTSFRSYSSSPSTSVVRTDVMSAEDEWQHIQIPEETEFLVISPSDFQQQQQGEHQQRQKSQLQHEEILDKNNRSSNNIMDRLQVWNRQRNLQRNQLGASISKTFTALSREDPDQMEVDAIQRAMELSMLDISLVYQPLHNHSHQQKQRQELPHKILNISENSNPTEIKTAYHKLARQHHPDKGGDANKFEQIARAYRSLLSSSVTLSVTENTDSEDDNRFSTATWDKELQDHRRLVNDLFQADGMDLNACVTKQLAALDILGLAYRDAGAINRNERNEIIHNSCFYLSLATSYLWGIGALSFNKEADYGEKDDNEFLVGDTALQLKRNIEAAVVKAHPEWASQGMVGEEVQAFSDFLVYSLDSQTLLSDWAVVVFDCTSGFCDIYKGRHYEHQNVLNSNTITLQYIPGHYQPLIPSNSFARRPSLKDIITTLDDLGVYYVVTNGNL